VFIGNWVLRKACEQAHHWHLANPGERPLTMSVNVSGRQFKHPDIVERVGKILRETQVDPTAIKLEITETVTMDDADRTIRVVDGLKRLGVRLSIDDFGTGYSSLSYLRRFPMDTLKIDRSFVKNLASNPENVEIVRTIMSLARSLGMDVVAEGAETADEIALLKALDCDFSQGYFFSKPVDSEQADNLLREMAPSSSLDSSPSYATRRTVPRYTFAAVAEVTETGTETCIKGRIAQISSKGCYIDSRTTPPVGTLLELYIASDRGTFATKGRILYVQERIGMGVAFLDLSKDQSQVLDSWLADLPSAASL
jgi:EAL domain-containing protein (putative c-di-GMP-specific phosphodiesterase class I)